jgi:hypothetical protein
MATNIRLKRSAIEGRIPQVSDLELGELAINTYDGKMYIKKSVDGVESVIEVSNSGTEFTAFTQYTYTAINGQTLFTGNDNNNKSLDLVDEFSNVFMNGILLDPEIDYNVNSAGTELTLTEEAAADDILQINSFDQAIFNGNLSVDSLQLSGMDQSLDWDSEVSAIRVFLDSNTHIHLGQDIVRPVYNGTTSIISRGTVLGIVGVHEEDVSVVPYIADGTYLPGQIGGVAANDIPVGGTGFATTFGCVDDFDTTGFSAGSFLYASSTTPGVFQTTAPAAPNLKIIVGLCLNSDDLHGKILVRPDFFPLASDVNYDNTVSGLTSSNVQGALDELQQNKASVDLLSSNIVLFPTDSTNPDVTGHNLLVISKDDTNYDTTAVDIPTGNILETETMVGQLASAAGLLEGSIAGITVSLLGNIEKLTGNQNQGAHFYFKMYRREDNGTEHLMGESFHTSTIYETDGYEQFSSSVYLSDSGQSTFALTDRIVLRFYGIANATGTSYQFQFGGAAPIRAIVPVQIAAIPARSAQQTPTDTTGFNNKLNSTDTNVQAALEALDDHVHTISEVTGLQTELNSFAASDLSNVGTLPSAVADQLKGQKGEIGVQGSKGDTGAQGLKGEVGVTGSKGAQGSQGLKGDLGAQGATGSTGPTGSTGAQGLQGSKGDTGATGAQGSQGQKGEVGATGPQGATGAQGSKGSTGATGAQGLQGIKGSTGATGAQGSKGDIGAKGSTGATGAQGSQGPQGATGSTGSQGQKGATGAQGATGSTGQKGDTGAGGATGPKGSIGSTGSTGAQGSKGQKGTAGSEDALPLAGGTLSGKLIVNAAMHQQNAHYPNVSYSASGNTTGRIKIALPDTSSDYDMMTIELTVYEYNSDSGTKIYLSGHNWTSGWYNTRATVIGGYSDPIYLARSTSDGKHYIVLGDTGSTWNYVTVHVDKVTTAGFYSVQDWTLGWTVTKVTTENTTYSQISSNMNQIASNTLETRGHLYSNGLNLGGQTFADSSRNLTNIGNINLVGKVEVTGGEGREIRTYMPSSYTTNDIVSGHEYGWYDAYWRIGMSRSGSTAGEAFRFNFNGSYVAQVGTTGIFDGEGYRVNGTTVIDSNRNFIGAKGTFTGTGTGGAPTLDIINSTATVFNHSAEIMTPNMTTGQHNVVVIGRSSSTKNSGYIGYLYSGSAGDNANKITFGHWGNDDLVTIDGLGNTNINEGALQIGGSTVIDSSRNLTNIGVIKGGQVSVDVNTFSLDIYPSADGTAATGGWARSLNFRNSTSGTQRGHFGALGSADSIDYIFMSIGSDETDYSSNDFRVYSDRVYTENRVDAGYYQVGGTTVIDSSRNATLASQLIVRGAGNSSKGNIHMGDAGNSTNKWSYLTGAHYNADTESEGFALIGGFSSSLGNRVVIGGSIYESNPCTSIEFWGHTATTHATGGTQRAVIDSGGFNLKVGNYEVNGTTVIDSSRNATFTNVTSSGSVTVGSNTSASSLIVNDINGAKYQVRTGGYDLKFEKHDSSSGTYATGLEIRGVSATDGFPNVYVNNNLTVENEASVLGTLVVGSDTSRKPIQVKSNTWAEVQFFTAGTEYIRMGSASGGQGTTLGDFFVYDAPTGQMNLIAKRGGLVSARTGFQVNGTTVIDSSRNLANIGTVSASGRVSTTSTASASALSGITSGNGAFFAFHPTHTSGTTTYYPTIGSTSIHNTGYRQHLSFGHKRSSAWDEAYIALGGSDSYPTKEWLFDAVSGAFTSTEYKVSGTTVIDSSRNLTNIGTINSGGITPNGHVTIIQGNELRLKAGANEDIGDVVFQYNNGSEKHRLWDGGSGGLNYRYNGGTTYRIGVNTSTASLAISGTTVIDSSRNLTNIASGTFGGNIDINTSTQNAIEIFESSGSSGYTYMRFLNTTGSTQYGSIYRSFSSMVYGTSSDYRLKENVVDLTNASDRINLIPVRRFNFIEHPDRTVDGFLAHEVQAIVPEAIIGEKDEVDDTGAPVYQGIDQSKLVPLLTAALQEALQEIENLKQETQSLIGRVTNLENN